MDIDITEHRGSRGGAEDFQSFLRSAPGVDLEIERPVTPTTVVDLYEVG